MNITIQVLIALAGVVASCGAAYGLLKASITYLKASLDELKSSVKETNAKVDALGEKVTECDKTVALVALELSLRSLRSAKG